MDALPLPGASCRRTLSIEPELLPPSVEWVTARDTSDQRLLDLWCETVGPSVVHRHGAERDTGRVAIDSIALVSWNTHVGGADIERFVRDLRAGRFTGGRPVEHFVLLLQEVYRADPVVPERVRIRVPDRIAEEPPGTARRQDIVETATRLGLSLFYVPSMRNGAPGSSKPGEDRGNAILSTFELEDMRAIDLPFEVQRRVAASAEIDVETSSGRNWDLDVVSLHLDTRSRFPNLRASTGGARQRQAAALIKEVAGDELIVVGGDFNTWAPDFLESALPFLRNAFTDTPVPPAPFTFEARGIRRRLDYMFFRLPDNWSVTYQRIDNQYGSDHYPLLGVIRAPD
ncbi:MAG: endonuclease/exonuclease/phosphatase family protein [Longimicrobiales bacterium]